MRYVLEGRPVAWSRMGLNGKRIYDQQKHQKLVMGVALKNQHANAPFYKGPVELIITFYMPIPKRAKNPQDWEEKPTYTTPDLSNLIKLIEDVAQGILFENDCIIYRIVAQRLYSQKPRTEFILREVVYEKS